MRRNPLGQPTEYLSVYDPDLLFGIPRFNSRKKLGLGETLPFCGVDLWNAWDLTWLDATGKPVVATATIQVAADSSDLIESKSLKLYLNSLSMTRYRHVSDIAATLAADLSATAGSAVKVKILPVDTWSDQALAPLPGMCIDRHAIAGPVNTIDSSFLTNGRHSVKLEELHSHLMRSLCPVTRQPDIASVLIRYSGKKIDAAGLLRYLVSYRLHDDFHESCVERIFVDLMEQCAPEQLTVYARYNRRGGLDINPFRSNFEMTAENLRLWRQ